MQGRWDWASYVKLGAMHLIRTYYIYFSVSKSTHLPGRMNTRPPPAPLLCVSLQLFNPEEAVRLNRWWRRQHEKMQILRRVLYKMFMRILKWKMVSVTVTSRRWIQRCIINLCNHNDYIRNVLLPNSMRLLLPYRGQRDKVFKFRGGASTHNCTEVS